MTGFGQMTPRSQTPARGVSGLPRESCEYRKSKAARRVRQQSRDEKQAR
jgi:hypothetical protein